VGGNEELNNDNYHWVQAKVNLSEVFPSGSGLVSLAVLRIASQ